MTCSTVQFMYGSVRVYVQVHGSINPSQKNEFINLKLFSLKCI